MTSLTTLETIARHLSDDGVAGLTIAWVDNNGITRSRSVPIARMPEVAWTGVGITTLFAVFDSHDGITFAHEGLSNASGDVRLIPELDRVVRLAGQPAFAWAPGRQRAADGSPWPYDQRAVLERQLQRAADAGLRLRCGFELEMFVGLDGDELMPAHHGPAYSSQALLAVDEFAADALTDLAANGVDVGQIHAEYGPAQVEVSLAAADPLTAADQQVLARQTLRAAARRHGLRVSFAPLVSPEGSATAATPTPRSGGVTRTSCAAPPTAARAVRGRASSPGCCATCRRSSRSAPPASRRLRACARVTSPAPSRSGVWRTARRRCAMCQAPTCSAPVTPTWSSSPPTHRPTRTSHWRC
jgi:hypothetical protein